MRASLGVTVSTVLAVMSHPGLGQPTDNGGHRHGRTTLLVAPLSGDTVVPPVATAASGTGAFIFDSGDRRTRLDYDITWQGLESGTPHRIVLRNFAIGGVGEVVHIVCGPEAQPCPPGAGATLRGATDEFSSPELRRELAAQRIYLEIETDAGAELRGQLSPYDTMAPVRAFVARLRPIEGEGATSASGTAGVVEILLTGREQLAYHLTVANTDGAPVEAAIVEGAPGAAPRALAVMPTERAGAPAGEPARERGGTLSGALDVSLADRDVVARLAEASAAAPLMLVVRTTSRPEGELVGELMPLD